MTKQPPKLPLYCDASPGLSKAPTDGHAGLWYERFFDRYREDWSLWDNSKQDWIATVAGDDTKGRACGSSENTLTAAADRQRELIRALGGEPRCFKTEWRFVTGLGLPHPVENGFLWHPTLGVPYLPGATVKGLVRSWVEVWDKLDEDDKLNEKARRARLKFWFGSEGKEPEYAENFMTGGFIFFDALPVTPPCLVADVMTPHMGKWYAQGSDIGNIAAEPEKVPADWHDPVPVPFLVVRDASFLFGIAPRPHPDPVVRQRMVDELPDVLDALKNALDWLGAGAKTAVGYGRFVEDVSTDDLTPWVLERIKELAKKDNSNEETVLRGKQLALLWSALEEGEEKNRARKGIKAYWRNKGWWDKPPSKKMRDARKIYE
ncbi:MAG: type III-B CRISPR module RAMP protein Cmr6 [Gammaproteobacteria bacterium]|nr:type III-B CRISPR module RAMP protein Cmr6 [Gammaproteobacteria bacterium]